MSSASGSTLQPPKPTFSYALMNYETCLKCTQKFQNNGVAFAGCQHDFTVCKDCYIKSMKENMSAQKSLTCPLCPKEMLQERENLIPVFKPLQWTLKKQVKFYLGNQKSKKQWICRIKDCGGNIPEEICQKCLTHYCPKCKQIQHPDKCPNSLKTESTNDTRVIKNILICEQCGYENEMTHQERKKKMIKCGNVLYCKGKLCVQHGELWNLNHDQVHPQSERIFSGKDIGCHACVIY